MGSLYYIAPEIFHESYGIECDLRSTGVIVYILLSGVAPFVGKDQEDTFAAIMNKNLEFPPEHWRDVSPCAKDFVANLLTRDKNKRLSPAEALEHVWLKELACRRFNGLSRRLN